MSEAVKPAKTNPWDQITPTEAFVWQTGELARVMVQREGVELASIALRASLSGDAPTLYRERYAEFSKRAWDLLNEANDLYKQQLADWFARFETCATLNQDKSYPPPGQTLQKVREIAMADLDKNVQGELDFHERLNGPWTGEPYRTIVDRMLRAVRFGERGLSGDQAVLDKPHDNDPEAMKAAQGVAKEAIGEEGHR
jgi:hypothetical protein